MCQVELLEALSLCLVQWYSSFVVANLLNLEYFERSGKLRWKYTMLLDETGISEGTLRCSRHACKSLHLVPLRSSKVMTQRAQIFA